jgi:hypothetical protein
MPMQASVRTIDGFIEQYGVFLGDRDGCKIVELTAAQVVELRAALATPDAIGAALIAGHVVAVMPDLVALPPGPPAPPTPPSPKELALARLRVTAKVDPNIADLLTLLGY